jgi:hypothetical protein
MLTNPYILSEKRNATFEKKIYFKFSTSFEYRNKHYITLTCGTPVIQTLKFINMSKLITLNSRAFR